MSRLSDHFSHLADSQRFLSKDECEALIRRIREFAQGGGETGVSITSWWHGELRWARNRVSLASDRRDLSITVNRMVEGGSVGSAITNQADHLSLQGAVRAAERASNLRGSGTVMRDIRVPPPAFEYPTPVIWSEATYAQTAEAQGQVVRVAVDPAEAAGMLSAGYLEISAQSVAQTTDAGPVMYAQQTGAQCSITVRDRTGSGSGWAGLSSYDWGKIDPEALAKRALEKCLASRNPVALEPGRYTVILEPQAVHDLVLQVVGSLNQERGKWHEPGNGPFAAGFDNALQLGRTKLGLKVVDERVTISHDPMDPGLGVVPFGLGDGDAEPVRPVTWIDHGVLSTLAYDRRYALGALNDNLGAAPRPAYRMSGGPTSMDEMIRTTQRGLLVTRFSNIHLLDPQSLLLTGLTRDGLWLIENGKITKAVKNFRCTESPLFMLNSLDQLGEPIPVFSPGAPAIVPPLKAHDFSCTSLIDAV